MTTRSTTRRSGAAQFDSLRGWGNVLSLWRLCGKAPCRRSRCCRGGGARCFRDNFPVLPEGVRAWFESLAEAQKEGWPFDEAADWLDSTPAGEAFREWCVAVEKKA